MAEIDEKLKSVLGDKYDEYMRVSRENRAASARKLTPEDEEKVKELFKTMNPSECRAVYDNLDVVLVETRRVQVREHNTGTVSVPVIWKGVFMTAFFDNKEDAMSLENYSVYLLVGKLKSRKTDAWDRFHFNAIGAVRLA